MQNMESRPTDIQPVGKIPTKVGYILFVYSLCNGIGNPLLALQRAVEDVELTGTRIRIHSTFIFEKDENVNKMCQHTLIAHGYPGQVHWLGDLIHFPNHASTFPFQSNHGWQYRIIVLTGTPCKSISRGCRLNRSRTRFGIHASPSNLWWIAHRGIVHLQYEHGRYLLTFIENVVPMEKDLAILDKTAGFRHSMRVPSSAGAPRDRLLWSNWQFTIPAPCHLVPVQKPGLQDSSRTQLPAGFQYSSPTGQLPCLRAIFPKLFWDAANQIPGFTAQDLQTVRQCRLWDENLRLFRLPTLEIWGLVVGMTPEHVKVLRDALPCQGDTSSWPGDVRITGFCSEWAYCDNCSIILSALGECWHLDVTSHVLSHCLIPFIEQLSQPQSIRETFTYGNVHICSNTCPLARTSL